MIKAIFNVLAREARILDLETTVYQLEQDIKTQATNYDRQIEALLSQLAAAQASPFHPMDEIPLVDNEGVFIFDRQHGWQYGAYLRYESPCGNSGDWWTFPRHKGVGYKLPEPVCWVFAPDVDEFLADLEAEAIDA